MDEEISKQVILVSMYVLKQNKTRLPGKFLMFL